MSPIEHLKLGLNDSAKLVGKSIQHIRDLVREGFVKQQPDGKYLAIDVASGALKARDAADRRATKSAAASKLHDERTEEVRLRNLERRKTLVDEAQSEAIRVVDEIGGQLRVDLMAIPARMTDDIALRRRIEDAVDEAFGAAAKRATTAADRIEKPVLKFASARNERRLAKKATKR